MSSRPALERVSSQLLSILPPFSVAQQGLGVELYGLLARGDPVEDEALASALDIPASTLADLWNGLSGFVYRDAEGRVIGFGGLAISSMHHRFTVAGRELFTWCAWDALFLPEMLGTTAEVESVCPESGDVVRVTVAPGGVRASSPPKPVVSFPLPDRTAFQGDAAKVMAGFCHHVFFLASPEAGVRWAETHDGTILLSLEEAFELGRRKNAAQFGAVLPVGSGGGP